MPWAVPLQEGPYKLSLLCLGKCRNFLPRENWETPGAPTVGEKRAETDLWGIWEVIREASNKRRRQEMNIHYAFLRPEDDNLIWPVQTHSLVVLYPLSYLTSFMCSLTLTESILCATHDSRDGDWTVNWIPFLKAEMVQWRLQTHE